MKKSTQKPEKTPKAAKKASTCPLCGGTLPPEAEGRGKNARKVQNAVLAGLRKRSLDEWRRALSALPANVRQFAAGRCWWDFIASSTGEAAAAFAEELRAAWDPAAPEPDEREMVLALLSCGYPSTLAKRRAKSPIRPANPLLQGGAA